MYSVMTGINIISLFLVILTYISCGKGESLVPAQSAGESMDKLRERMVKDQIEARDIRNQRVLNAMRTIPRHEFVTGQDIATAYEDHPLPIGHGQTISQPYIVALMTELCDLDGSEKVLEIGTGSGYQAAVLSVLSREVFSIEIVEPLGKAAKSRLERMGYKNVQVRIGDVYRGWPEEAPFDVIILTASPPEIPKALLEQLADGGILVAPEGDYLQELVSIHRQGNNFTRTAITYVRFVPMVKGSK